MRLSREVRFSLTPGEPAGPVVNSYAGWPSSAGLLPYFALNVTVAGEPDPATGYLCNISVVDEAVRRTLIPAIRRRWASAGRTTAESVLRECWQTLEPEPLGRARLVAVALRPTPFLRYATGEGGPTVVSVTQSFEFAAAHRLYRPHLSDEENRRIFGKCTNPSGHGHNYVVEVTIRGEPDAATGVVFPLMEMERVVKERVIDAFDHKHLNKDCPEFAELNPSVENITRVVWEKLEGRFEPARLARVRVYETAKTFAERTID